MHVVHMGSVEVVYPTADSPADTETQLAQAAGGFSPSAAQAPTVSALCTPRTSSLSRRGPRVTHPPRSAGERCACPSLQTQCGSPSSWSRAGLPGIPGVPPCGSIFVGITQIHQGGSGPVAPHLLQGIPGFDPSPFPRCLGT